MPELPEVETVRRGLAAIMTGKAFADVHTAREGLRLPFPPALAATLKGRRVLRLDRRAKYILIHMAGSVVMGLHLGMSGSISIYSKDETPPTRRHDHLTLKLEDGATVLFNDPRRFGFVFLDQEATLDQNRHLRGLGPEPLAPDFDGPALERTLRGRKTAIKLALLNQALIAGIGNIYACEALYQARIDPRRPAQSVGGAEANRLAAAIRDVLERAIASGGSSLRDHRLTDGSLGYFQHHFAVYDRAGQPCPACDKGSIERIAQGGRSTFFCPCCQT